MRTKQRLLFVVAVLTIVVPVAVLAAGAQQPAVTGALAEIGFRETGYPIVDERLVIRVLTVPSPTEFPIPVETRTLVVEHMEKTNVWLEVENLTQTGARERTALMFASRDFPDMYFVLPGVTDDLVWSAGRNGDLYPLNEYIERYAPNWQSGLDEYPLVKRTITFDDGNIYTLPYMRDILFDYGIRDIWLMNTDWLGKVGKQMPTSLDEFRDVLRAFRAGIDNGTLPERGVPWYFRFQSGTGGRIASEFDLYNSFGVKAWSGKFLYLNEQRQVEFAGTDSQLIAALEYMHGMFLERLFPEEVFTDTNADQFAKTRSVPPIVGSFGSYFLLDSFAPYFDAMPVLAAPGTNNPLLRSDPMRINKHAFGIFTGFKYPEVAMRFIDAFAEPLTALEMSYGRVGHELIEVGDGTYRSSGDPTVFQQHAPIQGMPALLRRSITEKVVWEGALGIRDELARRYESNVWPQEWLFPQVVYTKEELEELSVLEAEIYPFVGTTHGNWIRNGGVRAGWDQYLRTLDRVGLQTMLRIHQQAVDRFYK